MQKTVQLPYGGAVLLDKTIPWYGLYVNNQLVLKAEATGQAPFVGSFTGSLGIEGFEWGSVECLQSDTENGSYQILSDNPPNIVFGGSITTIRIVVYNRNTSSSTRSFKIRYDEYIQSATIGGVAGGGVIDPNKSYEVGMGGSFIITLTYPNPTESFICGMTIY